MYYNHFNHILSEKHCDHNDSFGESLIIVLIAQPQTFLNIQ